MQQDAILAAIEQDILSAIDQFGCRCQARDVVEFVRRAQRLSVSEIGRKTYLLFDAQTHAQTIGINASLVVMLSLNSSLDLLALTSAAPLPLAV